MMKGVEVILNPVLTNTDDREVELAIVRSTAAQQQVFVVSVNAAEPFCKGYSLAVDPHGVVTHQLDDKPGVMRIELDISQVSRSRQRGLLDLGQTLKSFRDSKMSLDHYRNGQHGPVLSRLGPLKKPDKPD